MSEEEQLLVRALSRSASALHRSADCCRCAWRHPKTCNSCETRGHRHRRRAATHGVAGSTATQCWGGTELLLPDPRTGRSRAAAAPLRESRGRTRRLRRVVPRSICVPTAAARLLVLSACAEPSLAIQGELLWRQLAGTACDCDGAAQSAAGRGRRRAAAQTRADRRCTAGTGVSGAGSSTPNTCMRCCAARISTSARRPNCGPAGLPRELGSGALAG